MFTCLPLACLSLFRVLKQLPVTLFCLVKPRAIFVLLKVSVGHILLHAIKAFLIEGRKENRYHPCSLVDCNLLLKSYFISWICFRLEIGSDWKRQTLPIIDINHN